MIGSILALVAQAAALLPAAPPPTPPSVPATMPSEVLAAFASAEMALARVSACVDDPAMITPQRLATLDRRLIALQRQANGVWGPEALLSLASATSTPANCARDGGAVALATAAEGQLTQLTARLGNVLAPMRSGAWFGTMPLCGRGAVRTDLLVDVYSAVPYLLITLDPAAARDLAALTSRRVGQLMAFRAGGRILSEPQVHEPIVGGQLQLSGPPQAELQRAATVLKSCAKTVP